jgi:hypothetical protein
MRTSPEPHAQAAVHLAELSSWARRNSAPVLATRLAAYARAAQRAPGAGWDGLGAARSTLAEDLRRYEAIAPVSPLIALTRAALAVVSEAAA